MDTTSFLDQYKNATTKSAKQSAAIGGGLTAANGLMQLASGAITAAKTNDMPQYDTAIANLEQLGSGPYYSYDQLAQDYNMMNVQPDIDVDAIRGMDTGQKIGSVGNLALSGAMTGLQVGGPWGALVGGVAGLGAGLIGVFTGDAEAKRKEAIYNARANLATNTARTNLNAAHERLTDYNFNQAVAHAAAEGGKIRRAQSIQAYADKVLGKRPAKMKEARPDSRMVRIHKDGGTVVRFK